MILYLLDYDTKLYAPPANRLIQKHGMMIQKNRLLTVIVLL